MWNWNPKMFGALVFHIHSYTISLTCQGVKVLIKRLMCENFVSLMYS